jgi:hypothetical protein
MNTISISLSSSNTNATFNTPTVISTDQTTLVVGLSGVSEQFLPLYLKIDWGDNTTEIFENDILQQENLVIDAFSSIFLNYYTHEYFPSDTTLTKNLTATLTVRYINNDTSTFNIPLTITNNDYETAIEDLYLLNTVVIPNTNNEKIHQFITKQGGYIVELRTK